MESSTIRAPDNTLPSELNFSNGDFNFIVRQGGDENIIIKCIYKKDFREWIINASEIETKSGGKPILAKNLFKILSGWVSENPKTKDYFIVNLPSKLKEGADLYLEVVLLNPLEELQTFYMAVFQELDIKKEVRFQRQLDVLNEKFERLLTQSGASLSDLLALTGKSSKETVEETATPTPVVDPAFEQLTEFRREMIQMRHDILANFNAIQMLDMRINELADKNSANSAFDDFRRFLGNLEHRVSEVEKKTSR